MDEINALFQAAARDEIGYGHSDWSVVTWDAPVTIVKPREEEVMELPPIESYNEDYDLAADLDNQHDVDVWESDEDQAAGYNTDPEWYN